MTNEHAKTSGSRKTLHFDQEELDGRLARTREKMAELELDVLLVSNAANMHYLTGYDGWSFYVKQGVIVPADESAAPLWYGREMDRPGARLTTWLEPDDLYGYPDEALDMMGGDTTRFLADILEERGLAQGRLGVEMDNYWFSARDYLDLSGALPTVELVDATNLVNWVRTVKSPREVDYLRQAGSIVERVMDIALGAIRPGDAEKHAAGQVVRAQVEGTQSFGGDLPAIMPLMPAAQRTSAAHLSYVADRRYQRGDVVLLELAGCRHHYHAPLSRTVYLDEPDAVPDRLREIADVVVSALRDTLDFIAPGKTAAEVASHWHDRLEGTGVEKPSRLGYAFGMNYVPDWGEHTVSLHPSDQTVLEPGMSLHVMPGIWEDELGFECSEPILVTEDGCEQLVDFPQKLFTL